jgi:hypothetical protein
MEGLLSPVHNIFLHPGGEATPGKHCTTCMGKRRKYQETNAEEIVREKVGGRGRASGKAAHVSFFLLFFDARIWVHVCIGLGPFFFLANPLLSRVLRCIGFGVFLVFLSITI